MSEGNFKMYSQALDPEIHTNLDGPHLPKVANEESSTSIGYISEASNHSSAHGLGRSSELEKGDIAFGGLNLTNKPKESKPLFKRSLSDGSHVLRLTTSNDRLSPVLPTIKASTGGCDYVSVHTVAQLSRGEYKRKNISYTIIDCRYPYEYEAGHIKDAINCHSCSDLAKEIFMNTPAVSFDKDQVFLNLGPHIEEMLQGQNEDVEMPSVPNFKISGLSKDPELDKILKELAKAEMSADDEEVPVESVPETNPGAQPSHVFIFYCEFSSQRSPELLRFLRSVDRIVNFPHYPFLFYPQLYLMMGGYEAFYKNYPELCEPRSYLRMFEHQNRDEILYYVKLSKEIADTCNASFKASQLTRLGIPPFVKRKENENKPILRQVKSMLHKSPTRNREELLEDSFDNNDDEEVNLFEPEREVTICHRLRLVEHIIRKGSYVANVFERSRKLSIDFESTSTNSEGKGDMDAILNFSDANETLNCSKSV